MKKYTIFLWALFLLFQQLRAISPAPTGLLCQLLSHPDLSAISDPDPDFGWIVGSEKQGDYQTAYQIMVATSPELLKADQPDLWNTGKVLSGLSINIRYAGKPLSPKASYWWKVKTFCMQGGESGWSELQRFNTSDFSEKRKWPGESKWIRISDGKGDSLWAMENRHPVIYHPVDPVKRSFRKNGVWFFDFGRSAFSTVEMNLTWIPGDASQKEMILQVRIGERLYVCKNISLLNFS